MKRNALALLLAVLFALPACSAPGEPTGTSGGPASPVIPVSPAAPVTQLTLPASPVTPSLSYQANTGTTRFGVELLRAMRTEGKPILISPFSAVLALSMTANGANGDTLTEFETLFGADVATLNANAARLMADYAALGGSTKANIANSLWADVDMTFYDQFLEGCAAYDPGVFTADLDTDGAREAVNRWISDQTEGMIPEMLTENLGPDIAALLINAIYLNNTWSNKFEPLDTYGMPFYPANGAGKNIDFMHQTESLPYISADGVTGAVLPYDDGRLAFAVLMPENGLDSFLETLDGESLTALISSAHYTEVRLSLPKFTAEWSGELSAALIDMGLATAFDDQQADFTNLGKRSEENIYLKFVIQATKLEVSEDGTRAAAATVVEPADSAAPITEPPVLTLDHPFLYAIWDIRANIPLFLGTFEGI